MNSLDTLDQNYQNFIDDILSSAIASNLIGEISGNERECLNSLEDRFTNFEEYCSNFVGPVKQHMKVCYYQCIGLFKC